MDAGGGAGEGRDRPVPTGQSQSHPEPAPARPVPEYRPEDYPGVVSPTWGPPVWLPPRPLASWGQRAVAYLIDSLLVMLVAVVPALAVAIPVVASTSGDSGQSPPAWAWVVIVLASVYLIGANLAGSLWYLGSRQGVTGTTVGKGIMRIRLVDMTTGRPVGATKGLGRAGLRILLGAGSVWILSALWPLWDAKRQTWEDMAFKSVVVRDDPPA